MNGNQIHNESLYCSLYCFLLPIREAYEWKPGRPCLPDSLDSLLASNSWSVWMETAGEGTATKCTILLPIREAYEWKHVGFRPAPNSIWISCFQFVKRMNGNCKQTTSSRRRVSSCFQFVKRMNGNGYPRPETNKRKNPLASNSWSVWMETTRHRSQTVGLPTGLLPIREAYEWKHRALRTMQHTQNFLLPIREAYEWKLSPAIRIRQIDFLASNSWSVWMET